MGKEHGRCCGLITADTMRTGRCCGVEKQERTGSRDGSVLINAEEGVQVVAQWGSGASRRPPHVFDIRQVQLISAITSHYLHRLPMMSIRIWICVTRPKPFTELYHYIHEIINCENLSINSLHVLGIAVVMRLHHQFACGAQPPFHACRFSLMRLAGQGPIPQPDMAAYLTYKH
jgi:hypothetical protein